MADEKPTTSTQLRDGAPHTDLEDGSLWLRNVPHTVSESSMEATRLGRSSAPPEQIIKGPRSILIELHERIAAQHRDNDPDGKFSGDLVLKNVPHTVSESSLEVARRPAGRVVRRTKTILTELRSIPNLSTPTEPDGGR